MAKKIEAITKDNVRKLADAMQASLNKNLEKLGLAAHCGNISFNASSMNIKLTVSVVAENGEDPKLAHHRGLFKKTYFLYNLKESDFNRTFDYSGRKWQLRYFKPRSRNSVIAVCLNDGKEYKLNPSVLSNLK
jgi:hypothetical protein